MKVLITICARGGSKGIPGKNIKNLCEKPLIYYTIKHALQFEKIFKDVEIVLSSDSNEIIDVASSFGLHSNYKRPKSLSGDEIGKIEAIKDVLIWQENLSKTRFDYILDLDVTSPLRNIEDLKNSFEKIQAHHSSINLFSVSKANRNPYFNMVEKKNNGFFSSVKTSMKDIFTRQSVPEVYDMNASFYFYKRSFFDLGYKSAITDKSIIYLIPHICFDLDHSIDFEFMEFLMKKNKLDFNL